MGQVSLVQEIKDRKKQKLNALMSSHYVKTYLESFPKSDRAAVKTKLREFFKVGIDEGVELMIYLMHDTMDVSLQGLG